MDEFREQLNIPLDQWEKCNFFFNKILPDRKNIKDRYKNAVNIISKFDPVFGYSLRSKDLIKDLFNEMDNLVDSDSDIQVFKEKYKHFLINKLKPELDKTILKLSKKHSLITWLKVRKKINKSIYNDKFNEIINDSIKVMNEAAAQLNDKNKET